jgi:tRNA(Arg) A34 adenosine deaminase TadA
MTGFNDFWAQRESVGIKTDEEYMQEAVLAAKQAKAKGDAPIGAVLAWPKRHLTEHDTQLSGISPLETATVNVLRKAYDLMPHKVEGTVLYCTVEPDEWSLLSAYQAGVREVVFGVYDLRDGFTSRKSAKVLNVDNCDISYKGGVLAEECRDLLSDEMKDYCSAKSEI